MFFFYLSKTCISINWYQLFWNLHSLIFRQNFQQCHRPWTRQNSYFSLFGDLHASRTRCTLRGLGLGVGSPETLDQLGGVCGGTGVPCRTVHTGRGASHGVGPRETSLDPCPVSIRTHFSGRTLCTGRGVTCRVGAPRTRNLIGGATIYSSVIVIHVLLRCSGSDRCFIITQFTWCWDSICQQDRRYSPFGQLWSRIHFDRHSFWWRQCYLGRHRRLGTAYTLSVLGYSDSLQRIT